MSYQVDLIPIVFCVLKQGKIIKLPAVIPNLNPYTDYWIEMSCNGNHFPNLNGNLYFKADYKILSGMGKEKVWKVGEYLIHEIKDNRHNSSYYNTVYKVKDVNDEIRTLVLYNVKANDYSNTYHSIEGIYDILREFSKEFKTWDELYRSNRSAIEMFVKQFENTFLERSYKQLLVVWDRMHD